MIVIDASVWVSALIVANVNHAMSRSWLYQWLDSGSSIVVPTIMHAEVAGAVSRRSGSRIDGHTAISFIETLPRLQWEPLDDKLRLEAAYLAADLGLRGADATYVAVAQRFGVPLLTWDQDQAGRAREVVPAHQPDGGVTS